MNVKELIEQLSKLDPELVVVYENDNDPCNKDRCDVCDDTTMLVVAEVEALTVSRLDTDKQKVAFLKFWGPL